MKSIVVFGASDSIALGMEAVGYECIRFGRSSDVPFDLTEFQSLTAEALDMSCQTKKVLITAGKLISRPLVQQTKEEVTDSFLINCASIVKVIDELIARVDNIKIIVVGSESATKGSFDTSYFLAKAALKKYIEIKKMRCNNQQLIMVSPSTIEDAGMTKRREDLENLERIRSALPKRRFLMTSEVVELLDFLFSSSSNYLCNTDIEINGGKFASMI